MQFDPMAGDIDNQPYDNVEFPIRRPGPAGIAGGGWISPNLNMTAAQRENLVTGGSGAGTSGGTSPGSVLKDRSFVMPTVAEGGPVEEEEEGEDMKVKVEDQRQAVGVINTSFNTSHSPPHNVITTPPRATKANHVSPTNSNKNFNILQIGGAGTETKHASQSPNTLPKPVANQKSSPSRDSRISFIGDQSKPEDFTWSAFTSKSQEVFEKAYTRHKYFYKFSDKVLKQGTKMKTHVWDMPGKPGETMTYEQLLQGVLSEGERLLLGGSWLYFRDIEFYDPEGMKQVKQPLGEGRICLTNLRMMLMCAEMAPDAGISEFGEPAKVKKGGYKLTVSKLNNVFFQNIPIDCFESVELSSTVGTMAESKLTERKPMCCGLFSCVGLGRCGYTWDATPPLPVNVVKRVIRLGVYLPPWRTPAMMIVHLHQKMSLTAARDFVAQLQNHVPQMQCRMKHGTSTVL